MRRFALVLCVSLGLSGFAAAAASAHTMTPSSFDFGSVPVGSESAPQTFTLTAVGSQIDTGPAAFGNGEYELKSHNCPTFLTAGNSCTLIVVFAPFQPGPQAGTLASASTVPGGSPGHPAAQLSGVGVAAPHKGKKCKKKGHRSAVAAKKKCKKKK